MWSEALHRPRNLAGLALLAACGATYGLDASQTAPLSYDEFMTLFDEYQAFSGCVKEQVTKSGLDANKMSQRIAKSDATAHLLKDAESLLPKDNPFLKSIESPQFPLDQKIQLVLVALADWSAKEGTTSVQHSLAMGTNWQIISEAFPGACRPSSTFLRLMKKAKQ